MSDGKFDGNHDKSKDVLLQRINQVSYIVFVSVFFKFDCSENKFQHPQKEEVNIDIFIIQKMKGIKLLREFIEHDHHVFNEYLAEKRKSMERIHVVSLSTLHSLPVWTCILKLEVGPTETVEKHKEELRVTIAVFDEVQKDDQDGLKVFFDHHVELPMIDAHIFVSLFPFERQTGELEALQVFFDESCVLAQSQENMEIVLEELLQIVNLVFFVGLS